MSGWEYAYNRSFIILIGASVFISGFIIKYILKEKAEAVLNGSGGLRGTQKCPFHGIRGKEHGEFGKEIKTFLIMQINVGHHISPNIITRFMDKLKDLR